MPQPTSTTDLTIAVDSALHRQITEAAAADGVSVTAWMTAAARRALKVRDGLAAVGEWETDPQAERVQEPVAAGPAGGHGSLTRAELAAARRRIRAGAEYGVS